MTPSEKFLSAYAERCNLTPQDVQYLQGLLQSAVREAVLAEREACASVADNFRVTDFPPDKRGALRQLRGDIADIIRQRPAP
jgi:Ser/Thr protein kinase RdoA (MazF antagonist)